MTAILSASILPEGLFRNRLVAKSHHSRMFRLRCNSLTETMLEPLPKPICYRKSRFASRSTELVQPESL